MEMTKTAGGSPWAIPVDNALSLLQTTHEGLSEESASQSRARYGENTLPKKNSLSAATIALRQFASPLIFILIGAAVVAILLGEWIDAVVILAAVLVNAGLGFYQEFRAERVLENLATYIRETARVIRTGIEREIDSTLLVPGDIIHLSYGGRVPADTRIISENALSIDESILTGESLPVHKNIEELSEGALVSERTNMAFAGTMVVEGTATALVTATGTTTEIGKIARIVAKGDREKTPLQKSLWKLAWLIFFVVAILVSAMFALGISRGEPVLEMLLIAAAVAVGAVPEALPIALTVILAIGVERLAKKKGVMRSLAAAETLGSASVIMTDKTGTLTEANMKLTGVALAPDLADTVPDAHALETFTDAKVALLSTALWSTYAVFENPDERDHPRFVGRALEANIAKAAYEYGIDVFAIIQKRESPLLPFNSTNKFGLGSDGDDSVIAIGAPDVLLERSRMSKETYTATLASIHALADGGARLLGIARFSKTKAHGAHASRFTEKDATDLIFLGVLIFRDPIRPEAKGALKKIESLGVSVVMVTGDLLGTARAVARELGWNVDPGDILSGDELRRMTDEELNAALSHVRIFARVTPEDKMRIAELLEKRGEVVAMTGDGVNDAPALKAVTVGVALGSGSDVAKGVADLVLLDDNFKTIVSAIEEGRRMLGNIRKTFVYLVSTGLNEVFLIGGALLVGLPLPLSALQIIWVNIMTEGLPAVAYAFDEDFDGSKKPPKKHAGIFNTEVRLLTIGGSIVTSALLFALYWLLLENGVPLADARSILFICFASYLLVVAFSFRSLTRPLFSYPLFSNHFLNMSVLIGIVLVIASVSVPFLQHTLEVSAPPFTLLWIVAVWIVITVALVETAKWFLRRRSL